jgi:hypothetical protein
MKTPGITSLILWHGVGTAWKRLRILEQELNN